MIQADEDAIRVHNLVNPQIGIVLKHGWGHQVIDHEPVNGDADNFSRSDRITACRSCYYFFCNGQAHLHHPCLLCSIVSYPLWFCTSNALRPLRSSSSMAVSFS